MQVKGLQAWAVEMAITEPYATALQSHHRASAVFLRLKTNRRAFGLGCAAPEKSVTGETAQTVLADLKGPVRELVAGADPLRPLQILERLKKEVPNLRPAALAALDMALWDLMGRVAGLPLWRLLGGYRDHIATSVTIGILPLPETLAKAAELTGRGFRCLKLKGGLDPRQDAERVVKVREKVGPDVELRFDANQGFSLEDSLLFLRLSAKATLELLEQPTASSRSDLLARVTRSSAIPVMADESLLNVDDAYRLAKGDMADMVNVKLMKVGGLSEALRIANLARAAGLEVMVGCMDEPALSIAAGLAFALARPSVVYADLDGHLDLKDDPTAGLIRLQDGMLWCNEAAGLGADYF